MARYSGVNTLGICTLFSAKLVLYFVCAYHQ